MKTRQTSWYKGFVVALAAIALAACAAFAPATTAHAATISQSASTIETCGGWTVATSSKTAVMPKAAKTAFNKAMSGLTGCSYTPICYLGSQVVSGTKYYYLCRAKVVAPNTTTQLKLVTVYKNLKGKVSISSIKNFKLSKYAKDRTISSAKAGAVTVYKKSATAKLPTAVKKAFNRATKNLCGMTYRPVAYLGSQVVAGSNYSILCLGTTTTRQADTHLYVVTIYDRSWEKSSTITSVYELY